jgi:hypothetical protein
MNPTINLIENKGLLGLSSFELSQIDGGGFWRDVSEVIGYAAHITVAYFAELKGSLGASAGYPPR